MMHCSWKLTPLVCASALVASAIVFAADYTITVNRDTGEVVWDKKIATKTEFGGQEKFAAAPLVAEGRVIIQNGAGDAGTRGWVGALDVKTGNELWRWYAVPKAGDPGSETWR